MGSRDSGQEYSAQQQLASYWKGKCEGSLLPSREDIDPTDLADILPRLVFIDVVYEGEEIRLKYRMTGAAVADMAQREVTGLWLHELYTDEQMARFVDLARQAIENREPKSFETNMPSPGREFIEISVLGCPLSSNGQDIDAIALVVGQMIQADEA